MLLTVEHNLLVLSFTLKSIEAPELHPEDSLPNFSESQSGKALSECLKSFLKSDFFLSWDKTILQSLSGQSLWYFDAVSNS